jgi:tetratricopeptide (TPR) repeat protein
MRSLRVAAPLLLLPLLGCPSTGPRPPTQEEIARQVEIFADTATAYYAMGDDQRAETQARRGLELDPDNEDLQLVLAWTLLRKGTVRDVREAKALFEELQRTKDFRAVLGLAQCHEQLGKAFDDSARAIERGDEDGGPEPAQRVADLERQAREGWQEAERLFLRTLELHPGDEDAMNGLQRTTALLGRLDESVAWSRRLIESTDVELHFWRERLERPDLSADEESDFRRFVRQAQSLQVASRLHLANVLRTLGRLEEAEAELSAILALDPRRHDVVGRRAQLRATMGRWADALQDVEEYLRLTPDPYEHPDTQRAYRLKAECEEHLATAKL